MTELTALSHVWDQGRIPVLLRRSGTGKKLRMRLPFSNENREWLRNQHRIDPAWNKKLKCWELPKAWFNDLVTRTLDRYSKLYIIQPYREQEKCSPACMDARGFICQCSCMGANHGMGNDGSWFEVSETFATRWNNEELACRLMTRSPR